jgi:diguanylate cyclase (GGDEF)-like protein
LGITRSINVLFIAAALLLSCILTTFAAQREYQVALERLLEQSQAAVLAHPGLQLYILRGDESRLKDVLPDFLAPDAAVQALAYSNRLKLLTSLERGHANSTEAPPLKLMRADLAVAETGLSAVDSSRKPASTRFFASLSGATPLIYLTTPIFSTLDSSYRKLSPTDLLSALVESKGKDSLSVIGYLAVAIDRNALLHSIMPAMSRIFFTNLAVLLLFALAFHLIARRLTAPLSQLKQAATQVTAGETEVEVDIGGHGEFKLIGDAFNLLLKDASKHEQQLGLEKRILAQKADEAASELSEREQELSNAADEIDATRKQLHHLANYDHLTDLPNRNLFTTQLDLLLQMSARSNKPLALLCLNLNDFNRINESLGHSTGDLALREVAKRLVSCLRSSDILGHYAEPGENMNISSLGGDEFAMVLNELDSIESAGAVAQRIIDNLTEAMEINDHELVVTPSIGIAVAPRDGLEVDSLLSSAQTAMQQAESNNQVNFLFYKADMEATGPDDLKLELELRRAIERNELHIHFQPQVDTITGAITSAEALVRWQHAKFGQVSPARFIPLAERIGLIGELGNWVMSEACRQIKEFEKEGIEVPRLAINISPQQLDTEFVSQVGQVLQTAGLPPAKLELGLSEGVLMSNDVSVLTMLKDLKEMGVYLSLDNFGTNYAPLGYLSRHPLDEIKIDRSFVTGCDKRPESAKLVLAIIAMTRSLELHTVAEGVETEEEYKFLAANDVRFMRGYLFSKPVPAAELQRLLATPWYYMTQVQKMSMDTAKL